MQTTRHQIDPVVFYSFLIDPLCFSSLLKERVLYSHKSSRQIRQTQLESTFPLLFMRFLFSHHLLFHQDFTANNATVSFFF